MTINQTPSRETVANLGSKYSYEEIVAVTNEANQVNAEYAAAKAAVDGKVNAEMTTHDFYNRTDADHELANRYYCYTEFWQEAACVSGDIGHGSSEHWPLARAQKAIKRLRKQIKLLAKFEI